MLPTDYQTYIAKSRYARYLPSEKRRETWTETVDRYVNYFYEKHPDTFPKDEIRKSIIDLEVMPSMRSVMTAGKALDRDNAAGYNCAYLAIDDQRAFDECMYLLMCFSPETEVLVKGGAKKISELSYNDEVLSFNEESKSYEYISPSNIIETPSKNREKIEIELEDGFIIQCTSDHKFLTSNRGWVEAKNLSEEDDIKNYHKYKNAKPIPHQNEVYKYR